MVDVVIRAPEPGDADALVANLRPADIAECEALLGPGRERWALEQSMQRSPLCWVGCADGEVACIFGVSPLSLVGGQGAPWLLGTPLVERHRGAFIRRNPAYIARMLAAFPHLLNIVDARNIKSIAWLRKLGFTIHPTMPAGVSGMPFHPFSMEARSV